MKKIALAAIAMMLGAGAALAGEADVVGAKARAAGGGLWNFDVTVRHEDTGWDHYADAYEVLTLDGKLLGRRVLLHPHETEQPFTRSLYGVKIPAGIKKVRIRAHDKVHGYGGKDVILELK